MRHLPNILTAARLLAAPYVFYLLWEEHFIGVLVAFGAIAATDALDGYLARRLNAASHFGAYLDPVADKLLLSGTFLVLTLQGSLRIWLAVIVLGRDVLILLAAAYFYIRSTRRAFPPSEWGKASTLTQIVFVMFTLGSLAGIAVGMMPDLLGLLVAALVLISTVDYSLRMRNTAVILS